MQEERFHGKGEAQIVQSYSQNTLEATLRFTTNIYDYYRGKKTLLVELLAHSLRLGCRRPPLYQRALLIAR
jgi:hypothetical protein